MVRAVLVNNACSHRTTTTIATETGKYFGLRSIAADVALDRKMTICREFMQIALTDNYDTVIIDPIGELI